MAWYRWTFDIGQDGRNAYIDKDVNAHLATSAEFIAQKPGELHVRNRGGRVVP